MSEQKVKHHFVKVGKLKRGQISSHVELDSIKRNEAVTQIEGDEMGNEVQTSATMKVKKVSGALIGIKIGFLSGSQDSGQTS